MRYIVVIHPMFHCLLGKNHRKKEIQVEESNLNLSIWGLFVKDLTLAIHKIVPSNLVSVLRENFASKEEL